MFRFFFALFICLALPLGIVSTAWCADSQDRYIKLVNVDAENINLEVDGRRVNIPVPEGYEVMPEKEYLETYTWLFNRAEEEGSLPLCILINSEDNEKKKRVPDFKEYRIAFFQIDSSYLHHRFSPQAFSEEIANIKSINDEAQKFTNIERKKRGEPELTATYIYESNKAISFVNAEVTALSGNKYKMAYSCTEIRLFNFAAMFFFYYDIVKESDVAELTKTTQNYIKRLGELP